MNSKKDFIQYSFTTHRDLIDKISIKYYYTLHSDNKTMFKRKE